MSRPSDTPKNGDVGRRSHKEHVRAVAYSRTTADVSMLTKGIRIERDPHRRLTHARHCKAYLSQNYCLRYELGRQRPTRIPSEFAMSAPRIDVYEVRPRKDRRGVDLISDACHSVGCGTASDRDFLCQRATARGKILLRLGCLCLPRPASFSVCQHHLL